MSVCGGLHPPCNCNHSYSGCCVKVLLCGYHEAGYRALRTLIARGHEVFVATHPTPAEIPLAGSMDLCSGTPLALVNRNHPMTL